MRYIAGLFIGLCSLFVSPKDNEGISDYSDKVNEISMTDADFSAMTDSAKIAWSQELLMNSTMELERLKDLLKFQKHYDASKNSSRKRSINSIMKNPIDSCEIVFFCSPDMPEFKISVTKDISLIGISDGRRLFDFDRDYPVFTLKYLTVDNLLQCLDNIYIDKITPKIISKESGRITTGDNPQIFVKMYYNNTVSRDTYYLAAVDYELIPQYTYGVDAQYLISVVSRMYYEYKRNVQLPTRSLLGDMMWNLK